MPPKEPEKLYNFNRIGLGEITLKQTLELFCALVGTLALVAILIYFKQGLAYYSNPELSYAEDLWVYTVLIACTLYSFVYPLLLAGITFQHCSSPEAKKAWIIAFPLSLLIFLCLIVWRGITTWEGARFVAFLGIIRWLIVGSDSFKYFWRKK